ncbi:regulatory protein GemA (plasmid) [Tistrella mobilis]|uniref:regulatory protein GemA n=1 Tax=Tistrella mobilis TaxID=171437 RepID=UPI00355611E2
MNSDTRKRLTAAIHTRARALRMDPEARRDIYERIGGSRDARDLTDDALALVADELRRLGAPATRKRGDRKPAPGAQASKLRALWISGHQLGVIADPSQRALAHWVERVTGGRDKGGASDLRFLTPGQAARAIDALRDWLVRDGGMDARLAHSDPRAAVILALAARVPLALISSADRERIINIRRRPDVGRSAPLEDALIVRLGAILRARREAAELERAAG